jgi:beta-phosphoglucomutase-like phosphatase (HAD superfamily)
MEFTCAAVLFDADGTLIDSIPAVERTRRTWSTEYGLAQELVAQPDCTRAQRPAGHWRLG